MTDAVGVDEAARRAVPADRADVERLLLQARAALVGQRGAEQWLATDAPAVPSATELTTAQWYVGTLDDVVVGAQLVVPRRWPDGRVVLEIRFLYVEPEARELGVGEALVDAVLADARATGAFAVESTALPGDRDLKNLFERFGLVARAITVHKAVAPG